MKKYLIPIIMITLIPWQVISALASCNEVDFKLYNISDSKTIVMDIRGTENTSFFDTVTAGPGQCAVAFPDNVTAWWLSSTTYRWTITLYSMEDGDSSYETMAEIKLVGQNIYLLWATWLDFYVAETTLYSGDVGIDANATFLSATEANFIAYAE